MARRPSAGGFPSTGVAEGSSSVQAVGRESAFCAQSHRAFILFRDGRLGALLDLTRSYYANSVLIGQRGLRRRRERRRVRFGYSARNSGRHRRDRIAYPLSGRGRRFIEPLVADGVCGGRAATANAGRACSRAFACFRSSSPRPAKQLRYPAGGSSHPPNRAVSRRASEIPDTARVSVAAARVRGGTRTQRRRLRTSATSGAVDFRELHAHGCTRWM
jgi:hypothetical protein